MLLQNKSKTMISVNLNLKMAEDTKSLIDQYLEFSGLPKADFFVQCAEHIVTKDKDFRDWLKTQSPSNQPA